MIVKDPTSGGAATTPASAQAAPDGDSSTAVTSDSESQHEEPSKSQRKREALAMRSLGVELAELSQSERARIPLPDDIREAVEELNRTPQRSAHKRQLGWLAKRLRQVDPEPIRVALEALGQAARAHTQSHHLIEQWRDRLLGLENDSPAYESPAEALTAFLDRYPHADRQLLRQLQRSAVAERESERSPRASRQLFKLLRDTITAPADSQF